MRTPHLPRHTRHRAVFALLVPLALIAAACGGDDDDSTATGNAASSGGGDDMSINITTPSDGAEVGSSFDVDFDTSVDLGETDTGLHHVHLYYDGNTADGEYDLAYGNSFTVDRDLGSGEHTIKAVIANADHSLTDASDEVTVDVGEGGGSNSGGGGTDDTTEDDSGGDYGY